jgi:predicted amidohydrolase YtcJ
MPGFIESHMHLFAGAGELDNFDLQGVHGFEALAQAVSAYAAARPGDYLLIGNQADYTIISETESLTRHHLDQILADRPLLLFSPDHHTAWANTTALTRVGILSGKVVGAGNEVVMDGYEEAVLVNGKRDSRHRVEPIEVVHDDDISRFASLGVLASRQPPHPPGSHGLPLEPTISRIGKAKWHLAYAWNTLRAEGARLVFASDWPVSDINPIRSVQSAMICLINVRPCCKPWAPIRERGPMLNSPRAGRGN